MLPQLVKRVIVPPAVIEEFREGKRRGVDLPDLESLNWVVCRHPNSLAALPLVSHLGAGEREVLALALESPGTVAILDDNLARQTAEALGIPITGTLGVLVDAKRKGLLSAVSPLLDQLGALRFRLAPHTKTAVLKLVKEIP